jgi:sRNA-binding carbon storage regulator CsrA
LTVSRVGVLKQGGFFLLNFTRRSGESLRFISGEHTVIIHLTLDGPRAKLAIDAPKAVKIYREELIIKEPELKGAF